MALTKAHNRMIEGAVSNVADLGATGDGSTNDYTAFVSAMAAGNTVYVPKGTYAIGTALTLTGHFVFDEGAKIKANAALVFNRLVNTAQVLLSGACHMKSVLSGLASLHLILPPQTKQTMKTF